jgi:hypothetical protein
MQEIRKEGRVADVEELAVLFRGLEWLESMVATIRDTGELPPPDPALAAVLSNRLEETPSEGVLPASDPAHEQEAVKKKVQPPIL